jgi:ribosomal protein S18 acetylase RimI-like enzyme
MPVGISRLNNGPLFMTPTQQRSYMRFTRSASTTIRSVSSLELVGLLPELAELFRETVNGGSPLGFLAPITHAAARDYWISLIRELEVGSRILLIASGDNIVVGSGQLELSQRPNSPHRAELQKLFVERASRGQGIGRSLVRALHDSARENGRTLIRLSTRHGEPAEKFYKSLGYQEVGVIPGWTIDRAGERYDHVELYQDLSGKTGDRE